MTHDEVCGFVFAVAGAPELIPPSEWLPKAFDGEMPEFESDEQARSVIGDLMETYNAFAAGRHLAKRYAPPFREEILANLDEDAAVARWSRGFHRGHRWLEGAWPDPLPEEVDAELGSTLLILTFFSSPALAEAYRKESTADPSLAEIAEVVRAGFGPAMVEYVQLGQLIYRARLAADREPAVAAAKVGRNAPCPCGSGRKYKRCCGALA